MPSVKTKTKSTPKVDVDTETKAEVQADAGLAKLYANYDKAVGETKSLTTQLIDYIEANELTRAVVRKTLEERGLSEASAISETSRLFGFLKPKFAHVREAIAEGRIKMSVAREAIREKPTGPRPQPPIEDLVKVSLLAGARKVFRVKLGEDEDYMKQKAFIALANEAWVEAVDEHNARIEAAEAAKGGSNGNGDEA